MTGWSVGSCLRRNDERGRRNDGSVNRACGLIGLGADWHCFVDFYLAAGAKAEVRVVR